jgi:hypothetical protein
MMTLRRADICVGCGLAMPAGIRAVWDAQSRAVRCVECSGEPRPGRNRFETDEASTHSPAVRSAPSELVSQATTPTIEPDHAPENSLQFGAAGASAQREYERRVKRREDRVRARHPRLGGLILALSDAPASTRVWAQGAAGERAVAAKLDALAGEHVAVLHDRTLRHSDGRLSRANVDHIAVAATGVWVVDAKTHQGALEVRRSGGLLSPRTERLFIGGRDRTKLVEGLAGQVAAVKAQLSTVGAAEVPVHGALCFVGTELPWFGDRIAGVPLVGRRGLGKLLKRAGDLVAEDRQVIADFLATRFPPAR